MKEALLSLAPSDLRLLAAGLRMGRLCPPYLPAGMQRLVHPSAAAELAAELQELAACGAPPSAIAAMLDILADRVVSQPPVEDLVDVVTTGPEVGGVANRDTCVVVAELFRNAESSVLVAGYAVHQGRRVFQALAERMAERNDLGVRMFLDIQRKPGDTSAASEIVKRFAQRFCDAQWPAGHRLPELFFDPRSLATERQKRAALHAKCVVVDGADVFVSSANFTEAAQQRNIEVGLLIRSATIAGRLVRFFDSLVEGRHFERVL